MDFLRRIGRFIGGAAQNVGRAVQQAPRFISRGVQDAERARQQAVAQVQRNLPRFQAPPPPRIQLPQIQIPRVQAPKIDLGAVSRALQGVRQGADITKRTFLGQQLTPQQQRIVGTSPQLQRQLQDVRTLGKFTIPAAINPIVGAGVIGGLTLQNAPRPVRQRIEKPLLASQRNVQSFGERLYGGQGRTAIRTAEFVLPGKTENISEGLIQRLFPEAGSAAGRRGLTPLADPRSFGGRLGTGAKATVDVAGIVLPSTAATRGLQATQLAQRGMQGGRLARLGTIAATEAVGGIPASFASIAQARGQQKPVDLPKEVGIGLAIDAATPLGLKLLGKGYKAVRGAITNVSAKDLQAATKSLPGATAAQAKGREILNTLKGTKTAQEVDDILTKNGLVLPDNIRTNVNNQIANTTDTNQIRNILKNAVAEAQATPTMPVRPQRIADQVPSSAMQPKPPKGQEALYAEARKFKTADEFVKNQNKNTITVYHRTNANPQDIYKKGFISKENTNELFVSTKKAGQNIGYGENVIPIRVNKKLLRLDDQFPSGEKHYAIKTNDASLALQKQQQLTDIWKQANQATGRGFAPGTTGNIYETVPESAMRPKAPKGEAVPPAKMPAKPAVQPTTKPVVTAKTADESFYDWLKGQKTDLISEKTRANLVDDGKAALVDGTNERLYFEKQMRKAGMTEKQIKSVLDNTPTNELGKYNADDVLYKMTEYNLEIKSQLRAEWDAMPVKPQSTAKSVVTAKAPKGEVVPPTREMQPIQPGEETARFARQLEADTGVPESVIQDVFPGYTRLSNEDVYKQAVNKLNQNQEGFIQDMISGKIPSTAENNAAAMVAIRRLVDEGSKDSLKKASKLAQATIAQGTDAGRAVQIFSRWRATTPEGALIKAERLVNEINEKTSKSLLAKLKKTKMLELSPEKRTKINELANNVQQFAEGSRERQVAEALLFKEIQDIAPITIGQKLSTIQYLAQLLNVKTAVRNVLGNTTAAGANDTANFLAAGIDSALYKLGLVKQRSVTLPNIIIGLKGAKKGAKYAIEDVQLGIKTSGAAGSYDIQPQIFQNGILRRLENALGYELSVPDKAFYQRAFDISIDNQMKAAAKSGVAVNKPTAAMIAQANEEGLYQTFQNNSALAKALSATKRGLNFGKEFGLGDLILKYPKTPGNIISQGIDFTPVGIVRGSYDLIKAINTESTVAQQRNAILNIGRGLTGTGLISLGAVLANVGIMTADKEFDKKKAAFERVTGAGPFTINLTALQRFVQGKDPKRQTNDLLVNYDWLQPNAIQLSMGANAVLAPIQKNKTGEFLDNLQSSINASVNTVVEQPVLQGVSRILSKVAGGGVTQSDIVGAITDTLASTPASFIPSTINQIGQSLDKFSRETRAANPISEAYNKTIARIPGLRQTLPMKYDVLGKPINTFDPQAGGNNIFNVFLNPSFPRKIKEDAAINLIDDLYKKTASTEQFPRVTGDSVEITLDGKKEKLKLSTEQITKYQEYVGSRTQTAYTQLAQDPRFTSLSPEEQVNKMANILTDINTAAKMQLFGHSPKQKDKGATNILEGGNPVDYSLNPPKKTPKVKVSKARRGRRATGRRRGGRGRIAKVRVKAPKVPRVSVKGLPSAPKAKKVSFKVPKPKATARKSIKIKTG